MSTSAGEARDRIFISYRRDDARGASGRVWDWLRIGFGRERVFRDVASIGAGKWRQKIDEALGASKACVAVIGRRWADGTNLPRLRDPSDMVRHELETALASGERGQLTVIPLLVEDAQLSWIPTDKLPESLRPLLADWNVLALSESGWDEDTRRLIETIAAATGIALRRAELEEVMALMAGGLQGLARKQVASRMDAGGLEGGVQALEALLHQVAGADPGERPALKAAMAALAEGDTRLAEEAFEQEMQNSRRMRLASEQVAAKAALVAAEERKREGDAARNVGNLAKVRGDLGKASAFFEQALEANPEDLEAGLQLGYTWIDRGNLQQAHRVFDSMIIMAIALRQQPQEGWALRGLGEVLVSQGDSTGALIAYMAGLKKAEDQAEQDPTNMKSQNELSTSHARVGDILLIQEKFQDALESYQNSLAITEVLIKRDPNNVQWQRNLSVCQEKVGDALLKQADRPESLLIRSALPAILDDSFRLDSRDPVFSIIPCGPLTALSDQNCFQWKPGNELLDTPQIFLIGLDHNNDSVKSVTRQQQWLQDLYKSYNQIGNNRILYGNFAGALAAYQGGLSITTRLANQNPENREWQVDLSISHNKIGDILLMQSDRLGAFRAYNVSLSIIKMIEVRDPLNAELQQLLAAVYIKLGDILQAEFFYYTALTAFSISLTIRKALVQGDPANKQLQRDLSLSHYKMGNVLLKQGNSPEALSSYQAGLTITETLAREDPGNEEWQSDLLISHRTISMILFMQGDRLGSSAAWRRSESIREALVESNPGNSKWQNFLRPFEFDGCDLVLDRDNSSGALSAYRVSLAIREALAKSDPSNMQWQRDLSVSHIKIGNARLKRGDDTGALTAYMSALSITKSLGKRDMANAKWQRDLSVSHNKIGDVLLRIGDEAGALGHYQADLAIAEDLAKRDPTNTQWQVDLAVSCSKLGTIDQLLPIPKRRAYLERGRHILTVLKNAGCLHTSQDYIAELDALIRMLDRA